MNYYLLRNLYEINSQLKFATGMMQIRYGMKHPMQLAYDTCRDQLVKAILFGR